jgi:hypothetical protein
MPAHDSGCVSTHILSCITRLVGFPPPFFLMQIRIAAQRLAQALLAGDWTAEQLLSRAGKAVGRRYVWLRILVDMVADRYADLGPPDERALVSFLQRSSVFERGLKERMGALTNLVSRQRFWPTAAMRPVAKAAGWPMPTLTTPTAVADWLGLTLAELDWFADCQGREQRTPPGPLRHYTYERIPKRSGGARLLEKPKARLKAAQRRLLDDLIAHIPVHDAAHGFRRGRSVASYAAPHCGQAAVLRFDLADFFTVIPAARVHGAFRAAGYPHVVARILTGLCTNTTPIDEIRPPLITTSSPYRIPHLPQGAPTSPALANLCAYYLDCRLTALAAAAGGRYTRYADDLAFSGGEQFELAVRRFQVAVCRVALEEGFEVRTRKSRFMRRGVRQQLAGVVVNVRPNVSRTEFDRLKAVLTNCTRTGPQAQNRDDRPDFRSHLLGRIAYVSQLNPTRGARLRSLFDRITWE